MMQHNDGGKEQHGCMQHDNGNRRLMTLMSGTTTWQNEGNGRHEDMSQRRLRASQQWQEAAWNMRHNDGNRHQHGNGKVQQGDRRYNDGDGRHDEVA